MATHSSILAWTIPQTEEPGGLQSMGSQCRTWLTNTHTAQLNLKPNPGISEGTGGGRMKCHSKPSKTGVR